MNKEIEYLKEHLYEIYKYKKSMKDLTYDMDLEHLLRTCKALDYLQQELERYKNIIDELEKYAEEGIIEGNKRPEDYVRFGIEDYVKGQIVAFKHILDKLNKLKGE